MNPQKTLVAICIAIALSAQATENSSESQTNNKLSEIVVYAEQNMDISSAQTVHQADIAREPAANGNMSDYLKSNPHIRFENSDESSYQRGEIKPASVSINGAEPNQTSYFVDNVNINNDLGLGADIFDGTMATVPQANHAQAYFFDANLLSSVTVHDSDVSASLGGFSGGAVVAKTKQYAGEDSVKLRYRTSQSGWNKFHIEEADRAKFQQAAPNGANADYQPKYNKHFFSLSVEQGLTENLGVVFGLSRRGSHIQQNRLISIDGKTDKRDHTRRSDNALVNFNYTPNDQHRFEWGLRYSNYRESKFYANNIDSDVLDYHQAFGTTFSWVNALDRGILTTTLAYDRFNNKRKSAATHMKTTIDKDGNEYSLGGMGNSTLTQQNVHSSIEYAMNPFNWGNVEHSISLGGIYQSTQYKFHREQDATAQVCTDLSIYGSGVICDDNAVKKGTVKAKYQNVALYVEDLIKVANFEFRPGIRLERDDYLKNTNIAPRFVARWKPWEDTGLTAGWNRYYGRSFASMKLAEGVFKLDGKNTFRYIDVKNFKTPYADEVSLGFEQRFGDMMFNAKYLHRQNKNRIVLHEETSGERYYTKGKNYSADIYTLQINNVEPWVLGKTHWNTHLAFDWLETDGIDFGRSHDVNANVILDGKLTTYGEMMKRINNYREEWTVRLGLDMAIPDYNLTWTNNIYVKAPIKGVNYRDDLNNIPLYYSYDYGTHTQWDTSIRWQPQLFKQHSVFVKFDVLNVLNKTRKGITSNGEDYGFYAAGREFWLELGYEF
ncbi:TonB-dependent receptor-like protein [Cricetibacter osteomyelitidis]|uniref:TonB-dependent receptor-like protein n=1 Tax=Cricetibacter osteomyelitidis TaxID=1521931 RepID=A0A4R2T1E7_9PAST|nr:TonB-dependent receptor plug domain-containing protein [Cricetibacter osteomyelitidis]TCP95735.1 TonB-dependent receptor-like protein [Cricetibacter osteomyelitidis]